MNEWCALEKDEESYVIPDVSKGYVQMTYYYQRTSVQH